MKGSPGSSVVKTPPANSGGGVLRDASSTLNREDTPEEQNGNLLQYSCLEKSHGQRRLVGS